MDFRSTKMRVTPQNLQSVQTHLLNHRCRWWSRCAHKHFPNPPTFLYVDSEGILGWGTDETFFSRDSRREVFVEEVTSLQFTFAPEVVEFEGKKYLREDFEKMLALLNPVG